MGDCRFISPRAARKASSPRCQRHSLRKNSFRGMTEDHAIIAIHIGAQEARPPNAQELNMINSAACPRTIRDAQFMSLLITSRGGRKSKVESQRSGKPRIHFNSHYRVPRWRDDIFQSRKIYIKRFQYLKINSPLVGHSLKRRLIVLASCSEVRTESKVKCRKTKISPPKFRLYSFDMKLSIKVMRLLVDFGLQLRTVSIQL